MAIAGLSASACLDECAPPLLISDLGRHGYDVVHAWDVGNREVDDEAHLRWATPEGRALFTFDIGEFQWLATQWAASGERHARIILATQFRRDEYGQLVWPLVAFLDRWSAEDLIDQVVWLPGLE